MRLINELRNMNQMSIINLLTTSDLKSDKLSVGKSDKGLLDAAGVSQFQTTLNGLLNGALNPNQANPLIGENGEINLEALKGMNKEQLLSVLNAAGITPEMLLDTASQLQAAGSLNSLSPEQLSLLQLIGGLEEAAGGDLVALATDGNLGAIVSDTASSANSANNVNANVNGGDVVAGANSGAGNSAQAGDGVIKEGGINNAIATLTQLANALSNSASANGKAVGNNGQQNNVILEASETNIAAGTVVATAAKAINNEAVIAPVDTGADDSQPLDPQNIANTVLNAGAVLKGQAEAKPQQANSADPDASALASAGQGKINPLASISNQGGNAFTNNGKSNPLLAQLSKNGASPAMVSANNNSSVPTPTLNAPTAEAVTVSMMAQPHQPAATSMLDGLLVETSTTQNSANQSTQTLTSNAANVEAQTSTLIKETVKATRIHSPLPQTVSHNVGLQISKAVSNGQTDFTIRIDPPELGRVNVKVEFAKDGNMRAMVTVDTREALNLLQRDAHVLERALGDLGSKLGNDSLNFQLKDHNKDAGGEELSAQNKSGNEGDFEEMLENGEDIISDILPFVDASRALDIRI